MAYKPRPGISLIHIGDTFLLAATREAWEDCPKIRPVPLLWAAGWNVMKVNQDSDRTLDFFIETMHLSEALLKKKFLPMFETLSKEGYLIPVDDEGISKESVRSVQGKGDEPG